ncbi:MAG TPA: isochorismatase family protein [Beijerinckiaceae bacterium]|nr:isochorismatase family protein [Beijerinckiaceae bacterium]
MAQVIAASTRFRRVVPVLLLTDLQLEHAIAGRHYSIADAGAVLEGCKRLLTAARAAQLPIAHFRRLQESPFFNPAGQFADWLEPVRPWPNEMVFEHDLPSCYSCEAFTRFFGHVRDPLFFLAGFGANYTGLATAIDAYSRGHRIRFVGEAAGSYGAVAHDSVCGLIGEFADLIDIPAAFETFERRELHGVASA